MERKQLRYMIAASSLLLCLSVYTGCSKKTSDDTLQHQGQEQTENNDNPETETKEIEIYSIDIEKLENEPIKVEVETKDGKITAESIVQEVSNSFKERGINISIRKTIEEDNTVTVDFEGDMPPSALVGSTEEGAILDCISMSLIDNLPECENVIFHVDGDAYKGGHYSFDIDEPYLHQEKD